MYPRRIRQRTKAGEERQYIQLVESYRREDGVPTNRVVAHLGRGDDILFENLKAAFAAWRAGRRVAEVESSTGGVEVSVAKSLLYFPVAVVSFYFRQFGLDELLNKMCPAGERAVAASTVIEALVAHRCIDPGSKLAFQRWIDTVAVDEVFGCDRKRLNNTRVHRALDELADAEKELQQRIACRVTERHGTPRILYLDLTDTWFEAGGGSLARRGETKQGHRSKRKINIALMVDENGFPMRWELLPGALSETVVLPSWLPSVRRVKRYANAILVFDRGLPTINNFHLLVDKENGHPFLTSVKSDTIPSYVRLDNGAFDALQDLEDDASLADITHACARLGLRAPVGSTTFRIDLGEVEPPKPNSKRKTRPPKMRMYLYFNPDIRRTKRQQRAERLQAADDFVAELNKNLAQAKQSRKPDPVRSKVTERLRKLKLLEVNDIHLEPLGIQGRTKIITSYQVRLTRKPDALRQMRRYDGISLLLGHPNIGLTCDEAIAVYRQKDVVEADFRTIKSVFEIQPTFHWTDDKIRSHIVLCILALLVERLIEQRLTNPKGPRTADAALAQLATLQLHRLRIGNNVHSCQTEFEPHVSKLARTLGVQQLLSRFQTRVPCPSTRCSYQLKKATN